MKYLFGILMTALVFTSCKSSYEQNKAGFEKLQTDLADKFGAAAYYTAISMAAGGNENEGYLIVVDVSDDANTTRQERWVRMGGDWENGGIANMQVDNKGAAYYKYQLGKEVDLSLLGTLIETSKQSFKDSIKDKEPKLQLAILNTNNTVQDAANKYRYTVILREDNTEMTHSYTYDKSGKLMMSN